MSQMDESFLKAEDAVGDDNQARTLPRENSQDDLYFQRGDRPGGMGEF